MSRERRRTLKNEASSRSFRDDTLRYPLCALPRVLSIYFAQSARNDVTRKDHRRTNSVNISASARYTHSTVVCNFKYTENRSLAHGEAECLQGFDYPLPPRAYRGTHIRTYVYTQIYTRSQNNAFPISSVSLPLSLGVLFTAQKV